MKTACREKGCADPVWANAPGKGLCLRHYKQDARGTLGKTREQAPAGEGDEVTFRLRAHEKIELERASKKLKFATVSEFLRVIVREALAAIREAKS